MTNELMTMPLDMTVPALADQFARSGMFPDIRSAQASLVKIIAGRALGIDPFSAMTGIHLIEGKPSIGAHLMAAAIKSSGRYNYRVLEKTPARCRLQFLERVNDKWSVLGEEDWRMDDCVKRGLAQGANGMKANWRRFPDAMLFARAISAGYRTYCPDVFGITTPVYTDGELEPEEPVQVAARIVEPEPTPQPAPQPAPVVKALPLPAPEPEPEPEDATPELESLRESPLGQQVWRTIEQLAGRSKSAAMRYYAAADNEDKLQKLLTWCQKRVKPVEAEPVAETAAVTSEPAAPVNEFEVLLAKIQDHLQAGRLSQTKVDALLAAEGAGSIADLPEPRLRYLDAAGRGTFNGNGNGGGQ